MNKMQEQVRDFHFKFGQPVTVGERSFSRAYLRKSLIKEESRELIDAINKQNMAQIVDGACDLIYVVLGTMLEFGIDIEPFFNEVHRTNMLKDGGPTRADGKIMKPEGWIAPDISGMLNKGEGILT